MYNRVVEEADRGRQKWNNNVNLRDPGDCERSALNHNTDEFSCAIGLASLDRIDDAIKLRLNFLKLLAEKLKTHNIFQNLPASKNISPFYFSLLLADDLVDKKVQFCEMSIQRGAPLLTDYTCVVAEWRCLKSLNVLVKKKSNVIRAKQNLFNLFLNEMFTEKEASQIADIFLTNAAMIRKP